MKERRNRAQRVLHFCVIAVIIILSAVPSALRAEADWQTHTLIVDPGHGGLDGGASSADGTTESAINLAIALKTAALARMFGVPVILTRESETLDYPSETDSIHQKKVWDQKTRAALILETKGAVLISIHQNQYPDPRPHGSQVLYADSAGSQAFGELTHSRLLTSLDPENRRVAAPISESIFLFRGLNCPAILVECGFLSNAEEAATLKTPEFQRKLALVLTASYLEFIHTEEIPT